MKAYAFGKPVRANQGCDVDVSDGYSGEVIRSLDEMWIDSSPHRVEDCIITFSV